jgi:hypothetical protein
MQRLYDSRQVAPIGFLSTGLQSWEFPWPPEISDRCNFCRAIYVLHSVLNAHRYCTTNRFHLTVVVVLLLTRPGSTHKLVRFGITNAYRIVHFLFFILVFLPRANSSASFCPDSPKTQNVAPHAVNRFC